MVNGPGEIPDLKPNIVQAPLGPNPTEPKARVAPTEPQTQAPDRVELSPKAREVQTLVSRAQAEPEVRPEIVEQARSSHAAPEAESSVPAAKVAEKLLLEG